MQTLQTVNLPETRKVSIQLQRILKAEYEFPLHVRVSKECRDIMSRILVPDPAKRLRVADIQRHVWYKKDLPPGVSGMNDHLPPPSPTAQVPSLIRNISLDCC